MNAALVALALGLLIILHELGHLFAARLARIPVAEFAVGFGPRLWTWRWQGVEYNLRAVPLGGFVLPALAPEEFAAWPLWRRLLFYLGGPVANLLLVPVLFLGRPAGEFAFWLRGQGAAFAALFRGEGQLAGLGGMVQTGVETAQHGEFAPFVAALSLSLAVLNLLPIPGLDGGQITLATFERLFPRLERLRLPVTVAGLGFVAAVMFYVNGRELVWWVRGV